MVAAQELSRRIRVRGVEGEGVPLVVAEHGERRAGLEHGAHQAQRGANLGAAIEEVTDEDRRALRVPPGASVLPVTHAAQQLLELGSMAVDVADEVEHQGVTLLKQPTEKDLPWGPCAGGSQRQQ